MIYRMLKKRNYSNISKKNQLMYLWNPFGDKYKVYYIFEKLQNEWKVIENASLKQNNMDITKNDISSSFIETLKNKSNNDNQRIIHGLGYKTIPIGGYMCSKSKQNVNNKCTEEDEILPLYGESDYSDYITDSEVENELFEIEQKKSIQEKQKLKYSNKCKKSLYSNNEKDKIINEELNDDIDIFDSYEDILYDSDLDESRDSENNNKQSKKLNNIFLLNESNISNKREGLSIEMIDQIIKECIEHYKMEWEQKNLSKLNEQQAKFYKTKNEYQGVKNEYDDITYKRIPSLIETIKLHEFKNDKSLIRCCGILQESIYTQCHLNWLLELYKKPEDYILKQTELINSNKKIDEKYEKKEKNENNNYSYIYEKEDWSDFIDDSEEIINEEEYENSIENNKKLFYISKNLEENKKLIDLSKSNIINKNEINNKISLNDENKNGYQNSNDGIDNENININNNDDNNNDNSKINNQNNNFSENQKRNQNNKISQNNEDLIKDNESTSTVTSSDSSNSEFKKFYNIYNNEILSIAKNIKDIDINFLENEKINNESEPGLMNNKNNTINKDIMHEDKFTIDNINLNNNNYNNNNNSSNKNNNNKIVIINSDSDEDEDDNNSKAKESYQSDLININKSMNEKGIHIPPPNFKIKSYNKEESMFERIKGIIVFTYRYIII
eukprot:jgi/Orpsp1_1/1185005/evm.model.c7180000091912.1